MLKLVAYRLRKTTGKLLELLTETGH